MARQDQAAVALTVDGRRIPIVFIKRAGGKRDSEEAKYPAGGMKGDKALGGRKITENVTLMGEYRPEINETDILFLESRRGRGRAVVVESVLDTAGNAFDTQPPWRGVLKSVERGDYDESSGDAREVTVEVSTDAD